MKFPPLARREDGPVEERPEVLLSPPAAAPPEEDAAEVTSVVTASRAANGASRSSRVIPRLEARQSPEKANGSTHSGPRAIAGWPGNGGGSCRDRAAGCPAPPSVEKAPAVVAPAGPSVLKTGVVEGMAYTLYSDGSIEAAVPQGTLRFGSISALRDHIESTP